ncbi:MAG: alpha/beta hydrolase fold domain-containing protein [Clostridia bacterium]|nr:alpha/beta hydrolase fold domain-containing protein [Clostridia bacterium]
MNKRLKKLYKPLIGLTVCFCICTLSAFQVTGYAEPQKNSDKSVVPQQAAPVRYISTLFYKADVEKDLVYKEVKNFKGEQQELKLDVYQPSGDTASARPAIVFVHGGGLVGGSKDEAYFKNFCTDFVKKGYVVFSIDYRLRENQDQYMDALKDAAADTASAVEWVISNSSKYKVDKNHIAFLGHSVGSDIINNLCYNDKASSKLPKDSIYAVVEIAGAGLSLFTDKGVVKKNAPPCLIVHGTLDEYIPYDLSKEFSEALKKNEIPYSFLTLKDGTHLFRDDYYEVVDTSVQFLYNQLIGFTVRANKQLSMEKILQRRTSGKTYKAKQVDFKADGKLDEWGKSDVLNFDQGDEFTLELPTKAEFSGTAMIGWNENDPTRIYIAATITDDVIQNNIPADGWWRADDTLEIRTDLSDDAVLPSLLWAIGATGDLSEIAAKDSTECKVVRNGTTSVYEIALNLAKANPKSSDMKAVVEKFKCEKGKTIGIGSYYDDTETWKTVGWVAGPVEDRLSYVNVVFDAAKAK